MPRDLKNYFIRKPKDDVTLIKEAMSLDAKPALKLIDGATAVETKTQAVLEKKHEALNMNSESNLEILPMTGFPCAEMRKDNQRPASNVLTRFLVRGQDAAELNRQALQRVRLTVKALVHSPLHHESKVLDPSEAVPREAFQARRRPLRKITNLQADSIELVSSEILTDLSPIKEDLMHDRRMESQYICSDNIQRPSAGKLYKRDTDENAPKSHTAVKRKRLSC